MGKGKRRGRSRGKRGHDVVNSPFQTFTYLYINEHYLNE